jgi:hypothetical protein
MPTPRPAESRALVADGFQVHAAAVIRQADHDLGAFAMQFENDAARLGLAGCDPVAGFFDAVHDSVAKHVLEGGQHPFQNLTIELARSALHGQVGTLAGVIRRLANDTRKALNVALERHHARTHQTVLQLGDRPRLLLQQVLRFLAQVLEKLLDATHVVGGFRQRARELLD